MATEPRLVALPETHPLAARERLDFADLLDEPFLALPDTGPELRDHRLALDARGGFTAGRRRGDRQHRRDVRGPRRRSRHLPGRGFYNTPLLTRGGVVTRPVDGVSPSRFVLAWRADDTRPLVRAYAHAAAGRAVSYER